MTEAKNIDTYKKLLKKLLAMSEDQLKDNISFYDKEDDEFYPLSFDIKVANDNNEGGDILDHGHVYLSGIMKGRT